MAFRVRYNACTSTYVCQNSQHVNTRNSEHQKKNSTKGKHGVECYGTAHNIEWDVIDASCGFEKLKKIEAIYIKLLKPQRATNTGY